MKQQKMARLQVFVMIILHLILTSGSLRVDHPLPFLPSDFYSGFVEGVFTAGKQGPRNTNTAISLKWVSCGPEPILPFIYIYIYIYINVETAADTHCFVLHIGCI